MKDVHRSPGGGKIKAGTLITCTKTSHRITSPAKKITGSMTFLTEDFTILTPQPTLEESYYTVKEMVEQDLGFVNGALYLASVEQHVPLLTNHLPFLLQESLYGAAKLSVDDIVDAAGGFGIEAAKLLETAARSSFETLQA